MVLEIRGKRFHTFLSAFIGTAIKKEKLHFNKKLYLINY